MSFLTTLKHALHACATPEKKRVLQKFFKTAPGEYGYGDIFIGVKVSEIRAVMRNYQTLSLADIKKLLRSPIHEERLCALLLLVDRFEQGDTREKERIVNIYLKNTQHINNWDLVDLTAPRIVGAFLYPRKTAQLKPLSRSSILWERRIAIVSTHFFIKKNMFTPTLQIAQGLLDDKELLIHKAVGWMLREVGKRDQAVLEGFLTKHYHAIPRIMLRYAIERFPEKLRKSYLKGPKA